MEEILNSEYWLQLRQQVFLDCIGVGLCQTWCSNVNKVLKSRGTEFTQRSSYLGIDCGEICIDFHSWLETQVTGKRFIADGTAGQFAIKYPSGYYGFLEDAPQQLKDIYERQPLTFIDL